jgi:hypothetical protein
VSENESSGNVDGSFFAEAFLEGDYLHTSNMPIGQDEDLDAYNLSTDHGSAAANDNSMSGPSGYPQQPEMVYASQETANEPINSYPSLMQGHDSSVVDNSSVRNSQGNTFGGTFNNTLSNPAFNPANYPILMPDEFGQSVLEPSSFASYAYRKPIAFGSANPFQARFNQSGSALPSSVGTYWNVRAPKSFVGNNVSTSCATHEGSR